MELSRLRWVAPFFVMGSLLGAVPPAQWVPARWHWTDPSTLDLLAGSPINCLLLKSYNPAFVQKAAERGIATLAVLTPGVDPAEAARQAVQAKLQGVVLEGDFPDAAAERVKDLLAGSHAVVVQLTARNKMKLGGPDPIVGTYQGVWPGIQVVENGEAKAAPSGNPWIDTNSGFIRSVRVWGSPAIWIGNLPPELAAHRPISEILRGSPRLALLEPLRPVGRSAGSQERRPAFRRHHRYDRRQAHSRAPRAAGPAFPGFPEGRQHGRGRGPAGAHARTARRAAILHPRRRHAALRSSRLERLRCGELHHAG